MRGINKIQQKANYSYVAQQALYIFAEWIEELKG